MVFGAERDERFDWTRFDVPQPKCKPTGFNHPKEGTPLTAAQIGGTVTGSLDAVGCDIGAYNPTSVTGADILGALHYGIVANGGTLDVKNSTINDIGHTDPSMYGMQRGIGIYYTNASGTISGNTVTDYQKGGIVARDGGKVTINDNTVTGMGTRRLHRPERRPGQLRHDRHCQGQHHQRPRLHADGLDRHGSADLPGRWRQGVEPTTSSTTR